MSDLIEHAARMLATAEAEHQAAQEAHAGFASEVETLDERMNTARQRIIELRSLASDRELTAQEAAALNLALLDLGDLEDMRPATEAKCRQSLATVMERAAVVVRRQEDLREATGRAQLAALKAAVQEAETRFCEQLQALWESGCALQRGVSLTSLWTPSNALRRAVEHLQPPLRGLC
jgi:hypothetical protein